MNRETKNILWLVPRSFLPVSDGASKANYSLLQDFYASSLKIKDISYQVTLVLFIDENNDSLLDSRDIYLEHFPWVEDIIFLKKKIMPKGAGRISSVIKNIFQTLPLTASFFDHRDNRMLIKFLAEKDKFDYIICDGLHVYSAVAKYFKRASYIYRSHNVEFDLLDLEEAPFITGLILLHQQKKIKKLELELCEKAQKVWTISQTDTKRYSDLLEGGKVTCTKFQYIPLAIDFSKREFSSSKEKKHFLFLGKLDWHPNLEGLIWFLDHIVPKLDEDIVIDIVGGGDFPKSRYSDLISSGKIIFHGFVEDLEPILQQTNASVIPIFSGSGTRIKVIDAISKNIPIVSTPFGVQGSGLSEDHFFSMNSISSWIETLNNWDQKSAELRSTLAQNQLEKLYSTENLYHSLNELREIY